MGRIASIESGASGLLYFAGYPVNAITAAPATIAVYDRDWKTYLQSLQLPRRTGDMNLSISPDEHWALTWHSEPTAGPCLYIFDLHAIHGGASQQPAR